MSLVFRCPACGNSIQVADEHAGLAVQCPVCRQSLAAPQAGETLAVAASPQISPPTDTFYEPTPPRDGGRKGLAIAALILGVVGFCVPGVNVLAIILGLIALILAGSKPDVYGGKGLAIAGLSLGGVGVIGQIFMLAVMLPALSHSRDLAKRATCAYNLTMIGRALSAYAINGNQGFPVAAHWPAKVASATGEVNYVGRIGSKRGLAGDATAGASSATDNPDGRDLSTTRNLWALPRAMLLNQATFVCPSSNDSVNMDDPQAYWDFGVGDISVAGPINSGGYNQCSYGYQVPYGLVGKPSNNGNPWTTVLVADKGPYSLAAEAGAISPPPLTANSKPRNQAGYWRPWNSPNHGGAGNGEGQNVLYADNRVSFENTPLAGFKRDNIYTQWPSADATGAALAALGNGPARSAINLVPQADTDTLIYP